jgi:hypothetical protein
VGPLPIERLKGEPWSATAKATARTKTKDSRKRKVKNNNQSFLLGKVCLDNADLFIHG